MTRQFLRLFLWHVVRQVARRPWLAALNAATVALGIAVYLAIQIANHSANRAFSAGVDLVAGKANLEIRGPLEETLWPTVAAQPGVRAVTGLVEGVVTLPDYPGEYLRIVGFDPFTSEPFRTFALEAPKEELPLDDWLRRSDGVAVAVEFAQRVGVQKGSTLRVLVNSAIKQLTVIALLDPKDAPTGAPSRLAAMDLGWAQELFGRVGSLDSLQILAQDPAKTDALSATLRAIAPPQLSVTPPRQRSLQMQTMLSAFELNLTALSMVALLVGVFLIYNTIAASVARRRVEIGILRAVGATQLEVRALFLGEACLLGSLGLLVGAFGGAALSLALNGAVARTISSLYLLVSIEHPALSPSQFLLAGACGFGAVLAGAWLPASEAARISPVQALSLGAHAELSAARRGRWGWLGAALLALAAGAAWAALALPQRALSFFSAFCILTGFAFFAPAATAAFARAAARWRAGLLWRLAADHLGRSLHRHAVTVAALSAAIAMMTGLTVMIFSFRRSVEAWVQNGIVADLFISPASNETVGLGAAVAPAAVTWLRAREEVDSVDTFCEAGAPMRRADGSSPRAPIGVVEGRYRHNLIFRGGRAEEKMSRVFSGSAVAVSEPFARKWQVHEGQRITLLTPHGPADFEVAGIYEDYTRDQGTIFMVRGAYAEHWPAPPAESLAVYLRPNFAAAPLAEAFRAQFGAGGEYSIYLNGMLRQRILSIFDQTFAVTDVLRIVAIVVAVAGVSLSTVTLVAEREREIGMLRAVGASRGQIRGLFIAEAAMLGLVAALLGLAAGLALAVDLTAVVNPAFFGWSIHLAIPWAALAATPAWFIAAAMAAAAGPAHRASQLPIAQTVREE